MRFLQNPLATLFGSSYGHSYHAESPKVDQGILCSIKKGGVQGSIFKVVLTIESFALAACYQIY